MHSHLLKTVLGQPVKQPKTETVLTDPHSPHEIHHFPTASTKRPKFLHVENKCYFNLLR